MEQSKKRQCRGWRRYPLRNWREREHKEAVGILGSLASKVPSFTASVLENYLNLPQRVIACAMEPKLLEFCRVRCLFAFSESWDELRHAFYTAWKLGSRTLLMMLWEDALPGYDSNYTRLMEWAVQIGCTPLLRLFLPSEPGPYDPQLNSPLSSVLTVAAVCGRLGNVKFLLDQYSYRDDFEATSREFFVNIVKSNHVPLLRHVLSRQDVQKINSTTGILAYAASEGRLEMLKVLLQDRRFDFEGNEAMILRMVALKGHVHVIRFLLRYSAKFDPTTALYAAARFGRLGIVRMLLRHPRLDLSNELGWSCLRTAVGARHTAVANAILDCDEKGEIDLGAHDNGLFLAAVEANCPAIVKRLLGSSRVDPAARENMAIKLAANQGSAEIVALLLDQSTVDPGADNDYALRWAAYHGYGRVVELLLEDERVDPTAQDNMAFYNAFMNEHIDVANLILWDPKVQRHFLEPAANLT